MITFLTYIVVFIGLVAFVHLIRVYELSRELKESKEEYVSESESRMNGMLFVLFMLGLFGFYIWLYLKYSPTFLPVSASEHGTSIDNLLDFNFLIINIVFFVTNALLFVFAYKYHSKKGRTATFFTHSNKLELIWTVIPSIVLAVIIVYGLKVWNTVTEDAPEDALVIELYSRQFDWTARYAGADGEMGGAHVRFIDGANFLGLNTEDKNGADDKIVKEEFHIPVNKPVKFIFRSQDVIHSAYMPHFRAQMNTVPGMTTTFHYTPTKTTAEMRDLEEVKKRYVNINRIRKEKGKEPAEFDFILLCNKICGASHYNMQMKIVVETEEEFQKWLGEKKTFAEQTGIVTSEVPATELAEVQ